MVRTYRDIAIEGMLQTVEEAMSQVIDWWGNLPPPMEEAIEQFRTQLGAAIDSVEFVKRALAEKYTKLTTGKVLPDEVAAVHELWDAECRATSAMALQSQAEVALAWSEDPL